MAADVVDASGSGHDPVGSADPGDAPSVLATAHAYRQAAEAAEAGLLRTVLVWVGMNPPESGGEAAVVRVGSRVGGGSDTMPLNGPGAPLVAAHAVAELAAALGMSTQAGQTLIGEALELAYRLPRLWARVLAGDVACWRARRVARETVGLNRDAADFVDRQLAPAAGQAPSWRIEALVTEALARFEPERHGEQLRRDMRRCGFDVDLAQTTLGGLVPVGGVLELPDALDLDAAVTHATAQRLAWGDDQDRGEVRARAVGDLGREHLAWHELEAPGGSVVEVETDAGGTTVRVLERAHRAGEAEQVGGAGQAGGTEQEGTVRPAPSGPPARVAPPRQTVLYLHLTDAGLCRCVGDPGATRATPANPAWIGRVENTRTPVDAETIARWCGAAQTQVTVRPVLDLTERIQTDAYEIPDRLAEQTRLREGACVFPYCSAPSRSADLDHVVPFDRDHPDRGGPTATENLTPLCRRHHGLKTRRWWTYRMLHTPDEPGGYEWTDRYGNLYHRDDRGTTALGGPSMPGVARLTLADPAPTGPAPP